MKNIRLEAAIAAATLLAAGAALAEPGYPAPRQALGEYEEALKLVPNPDRGRELFRKCAICHLPEGSGTESGSYPQIAGQINTVVIKQLADIRARNRDVPTMFPFSDLPRSSRTPPRISSVLRCLRTSRAPAPGWSWTSRPSPRSRAPA